MILRPRTPKEVQEAVRDHSRVWLRGAGSKPALSAAPPDAVILDLSGPAGMLEYDPAEFTFSALAGTPVADVEALLAGHHQYLPFDAPFTRAARPLGARWRRGSPVRDATATGACATSSSACNSWMVREP